MKRKSYFGTLHTLALGTAVYLLGPAVLAAQQPDSKPAANMDARLAALDQRASTTTDLTAEFTEEKFTPLLKKPLRSTGTVRIVAGKTRWDTESPHPVWMLLDGSELKLYFPQRKSLEVYPLSERLAQLALSPQPKLSDMRQHFDVAFDATADAIVLNLTPKAADLRKYVQSVRVELDEKQAVARQVEMVTSDRERTVITFRRVRRNTGLAPADLELQIPSDAVITHPLKDLAGGTTPAPAPDRPAP